MLETDQILVCNLNQTQVGVFVNQLDQRQAREMDFQTRPASWQEGGPSLHKRNRLFAPV